MSAKWLVSNGLVSLYRKVLSPFLHAAVGPQYGCRFTPTCSEYFGDALEAHGVIRGGFYGIRRLCRCQPWGGAGFDPVPEAGIDAGKEQEKNVNYGS